MIEIATAVLQKKKKKKKKQNKETLKVIQLNLVFCAFFQKICGFFRFDYCRGTLLCKNGLQQDQNQSCRSILFSFVLLGDGSELLEIM